MNKSVFDQPDNFTNRELSWLEFNQRILMETSSGIASSLVARYTAISVPSVMTREA